MNKIIKKITIKQIIFLILITIAIILPGSVKANTLTIKPDKNTLKPGESTMVVVSSDSKGRVNLKVNENGEIPGDRVSLNSDSQAFKVTAKKEGTIELTAIPQKPMTLNGKNVNIDQVTCKIEVKGEKVEEEKTSEKNELPTLSNLGIKPNDFKGFKKDKLDYLVTVPENVESIEIYANKGKEGQEIQGTGKKELKIGENKFEITVTSNKGEKNTYSITITREGTPKEEEKEENKNEEESKTITDGIELGLKTLKIENNTLKPEFNSEIYEYELKLIGEIDKLNIETEALDESEKIEILGNENLKEGQNIISILVSDQEGENTVTYQITVNKSLKDLDLIEKQKENAKKLAIVFSVIILIAVIIIIIKKIKNKNNIDYSYDNEYVEPYIQKEEQEINNIKEINQEIKEDEIKEEKTNKEEFFEQFDQIEEKPKKKGRSKGKRFK